MGVESLLKAGLKALPEKDMQGQKALNLLAKKGVKAEEFKFSGVEIQPDKIYTKKELTDLEANRKDVFGKQSSLGPNEDDGPAGALYPSYNFVSLEKGRNNPTYKENVYTMADTGAEGSRFTSEHFPDVPNYLMHTRTFDDTMDGKPTRVLQEIQSDLHQEGRVKGYAGEEAGTVPLTSREQELIDNADTVQQVLDEDDDVVMDAFGVTARQLQGEYDALVNRIDFGDVELGYLSQEETLQAIPDVMSRSGREVPKSPYEKSWLAKGIERELDQAVQDGRQQLAIPIKGEGISNLKRAEGVQKWYEGNVVNTAKKIAKQNGMDFEVKMDTIGAKPLDLIDGSNMAYRFLLDLDGDYIRAQKRIAGELQGKGLSEDQIGDFIEELGTSDLDNADHLARIGEYLSTHVKPEGTQYAIIKPKGEAYVGDVMTKAELDEHIELTLAPMNRTRSPQEEARFAELQAKKKVQGKTGFKAERPNLKLYSSPAAAVGAAYASLKAGGTEDDVRFELSEAGYEGDELDEILGDAKFAQESVDVHGDDEAEVMAFFKSQEPEIADVASVPIDPPVEKSFWENVEATGQMMQGNPKKEAYSAILSGEGMNAEQLLSRLQVISPNMSSITTRMSGYFGNEIAAKKQEEAVAASAQHIVNLAAQRGITMAFQPNPEGDGIDQMSAFGGGKWFAQGPDGQAIPIDEGFWEGMRQESQEITFGVAGAVAGGKMTSNFTKNPYLVGLGSIAGAVLGAAGGTELDYLRDSVTLHEEMSANVAAHKALTAAEVSVIGDAIGYPLVKGAGQIWKATKAAKDFLLDGNTAGAYKALKDTMFLSDSEITDITNGLNKATTRDTSSMKTLEERIQATVLTQPGGEGIVKAAGSIDPQAGAAVAKAIDTRAQDILATTATLTDDNVGRVLAQDLSNYTNDVKQYYGDVKALVAKSPRINDFAWDFEQVGVRQAMSKVYDGILDDTVKNNFALRMNYINGMSDSRTLTDLIETRQLVNDFKFNKRITKSKDFDMLNKVLSNIDGAIKQGAEVVMEDPKKWLGNYTLAKTQYAKMKGLERNVIARALRRPGLTEETAVKALTKYITAIDGSFQDVMSSLPKESRKLTEGAVIDTLANKFAAGMEGGQRAIHFPLLDSELDKITFTTPKARQAKAALKEMASVFRNDVPLSQSTGNIQIPKFQSYLTVDPVVRAKFEIASSMFNWIKKMAPTSEQRNMALVSKTAKLLENPLNAKLMKEVMEESGGDTNLVKQLVDLQKEAAQAKAAGDVGSTKVNFYGDGQILSAKGSGKVTKISINRIATYDMQQTVANKYGVDMNDKVGLAAALKADGYIAVQQGSDKVRRLK
tara:strand:+ start:14065 stop:18084 length:4020 start_codon:yes stop_codon:yes gene_type:complete